MPPRCREICEDAFKYNKKLSIFHVPQDTELGRNIIVGTALARASSMENNEQLIGTGHNFTGHNFAQVRAYEQGRIAASNNMNQWLKNMNNDSQFTLHRACSSYQPLKEVINAIILQKGLKALREENSAGVTPSRYLQENPYTELNEKEIIREYLIKMMGEYE